MFICSPDVPSPSLGRFKSLVSEYQTFSLKTSSSLNLLNVLQQLIIGVTMCLAMALAARSVMHDTLSVGGAFLSLRLVGKDSQEEVSDNCCVVLFRFHCRKRLYPQYVRPPKLPWHYLQFRYPIIGGCQAFAQFAHGGVRHSR